MPSDPVAQARRLRVRALLQSAIMVLAGTLLLHFRHTIGGLVVMALAVFVCVTGAFIQPAFLAFERFGQRLGRWVGTGMTWLLLVPFFYICFLPGRLFILLSGKDPLNRRFPSRAASLWVPRPPVKDPGQYRKQF